MAPKNKHRFTPAIVDAAATSMISEHQTADELEEVGDDPEEETTLLDRLHVHRTMLALIPR